MRVELRARGDFGEWRDAAREALRAGVPPAEITWNAHGAEVGLFDTPLPLEGQGGRRPGEGEMVDTKAPTHPDPLPQGGGGMTVPPAFLPLAETVIRHVDPARFDLAYRLLWRLQTEKHLLSVVSDPDMVRARQMEKAIGRDVHKMHAFVRFKELPAEGDRRRFVAWFEPEHFIVARTAGFFRRRFADMDWIILTPKGSAAWDGDTLTVSDEPAEKPDVVDDTDDLWRTYFAHIFNPARLKVQAMQSQMPKKYWKNLPEAQLIPDLIRDAEQRVRDMAAREASNTAPRFHDALQRRKPPLPGGEGGA